MKFGKIFQLSLVSVVLFLTGQALSAEVFSNRSAYTTVLMMPDAISVYLSNQESLPIYNQIQLPPYGNSPDNVSKEIKSQDGKVSFKCLYSKLKKVSTCHLRLNHAFDYSTPGMAQFELKGADAEQFQKLLGLNGPQNNLNQSWSYSWITADKKFSAKFLKSLIQMKILQ